MPPPPPGRHHSCFKHRILANLKPHKSPVTDAQFPNRNFKHWSSTAIHHHHHHHKVFHIIDTLYWPLSIGNADDDPKAHHSHWQKWLPRENDLKEQSSRWNPRWLRQTKITSHNNLNHQKPKQRLSFFTNSGHRSCERRFQTLQNLQGIFRGGGACVPRVCAFVVCVTIVCRLDDDWCRRWMVRD